MKLDKEVYGIIYYELKHYTQTKKALEQMQQEIIDESPTPDGQPKGNTTGNPTASKAMKIITSVAIQRMEKTTKAIEAVYNRLPKDKQKFFELMFIKHLENRIAICLEAGIAEKSYYRWRDSIIYAVAMELGYK